MAHDYKTIEDAFKAAANTAGIAEVTTGFTKTINSRIKSPCLQFDSNKSTEDLTKDTEVYGITADFLIYFNDNDPTTTDTFSDKWRELEGLIADFLAALDTTDNVRLFSKEIEKERFGYGFSVNKFIPIRVTFKVIAAC